MTIDDLPYVKMPYDKMLETASFVDSINRMVESGKMVLSFSCSKDESKTIGASASKKLFIDHYEATGGKVFETVSCLPNTVRMNLELDIDKTFDAFETFIDPIDLEKSVGVKCKFNAIALAVSRRLKIVLALCSDSHNRWAWVDGINCTNGTFPTNSFGYFMANNLSEMSWVPPSLRRKLSSKSIDVSSFKWNDEEESPLTKSAYYDAITAYSHSALLRAYGEYDLSSVSQTFRPYSHGA